MKRLLRLAILSAALPALPFPLRAEAPALPSSDEAAPAVTIALRPNTVATGDDVKLSDIADLSGDPAQVLRLGSLSLSDIPPLGQSLRIGRGQVTTAARQALGPETKAEVAGASETVVERKTMRVNIAALREEIGARLKAQLPYEAEKIVVSDIQLPEEIVLPDGNLKFDVRFQFARQMLGQTPFTAEFLVNGQLAKRLSGTLKADMTAMCYQASHAIAKGERLGARDFHSVPWTLSRMPRGALTELPAGSSLATAKRSIALGETLTDDMIERPDIVKRNDPVNLVIRRGPLVITATAIARESGGAGDMIRAINLSSKKEVFARIVDSRTAEALF